MFEKNGLRKEGLPPRDRNADVPEHANSPIIWMAGAIVACAVVALVLFGTTRPNDTTASNPKLDTAPGTTTGSAPASPSKATEK